MPSTSATAISVAQAVPGSSNVRSASDDKAVPASIHLQPVPTSRGHNAVDRAAGGAGVRRHRRAAHWSK
jgi:hypothetical protein